MKRILTIFLTTFFLITSSGFSEEGERFGLQPGSVQVQWTAFKTSERLAVSGNFKSILIEAPAHANTREGVLQGISFSIDSLSVHSGNPERDASLKEAFFGLLSPSKNIDGEIQEVQDGKARVMLQLQGQSYPITMDYVIDRTAEMVVATGSINMLDIGLQKSFTSLHERCALLHTGVDGISKTWPEVELKLFAKFTKVR